MKPRVYLEPDEFLRLSGQGNAKIIRTAKVLLRGAMYVTEADDYFYYTYSKDPLQLPAEAEVVNARLVQF